jgi:ribosomal protein L20
LIVNKKCCKEKLVLGRRLVCKKKAKNCVKRGCKCKNMTRMKQKRSFAEFWSSLFAEAQLTFDVYLANLTNTYKVDALTLP